MAAALIGSTLLTSAPPVPAAPSAGKRHTVLVEAEGFGTLGGWVIDQQFMDQMGSPFLMAHGLGAPVEDAKTTVALPAAGTYRVLVRTRDWTAPWDAADPPGKFQLLVDGKPLGTVFGTEGAEWHWQDGGTIAVGGDTARPAETKVTLALKDLTGFNGRCDAILLTTDPGLKPPNEGEEMAAFRRRLLGLPERPADAGEFDLVVVGGGVAGCCAAISAARLGLEVALIQDRPVLGGVNSSEVRVHLVGDAQKPPYPALGGVVREIGPRSQGISREAANYEDERKLRVVEAEKSLHLFLNTHAYKVETQGKRITAVIARDIRTSRELRFLAKLFADCTGDGTIGYLAGADYRYGREGRDETGESLAPEKADRETLGMSVLWNTQPVDEPCGFPECPWAVQFDEKSYQRATVGSWNWETGFARDKIAEAERIRDHGLRAAFGNWAFQKNHAPDQQKYARLKLAWVAYIAGKRESRRLLGDVILRQQDLDEARPYPDAAVTATWPIDLHYPNPSTVEGEEPFRSHAEFRRFQPYPIPYRCLYSRNVENLFMAGRNVSVTHVALGSVRVMRTTGMMGEVVGMAASICKRYDGRPRDVYSNYLDDLKELMTRGVGREPVPYVPKPPEWIESAGPNLARAATVSVSGRYKPDAYPSEAITDGHIDVGNDGARWVSDEGLPAWAELSWEKPQTFSAVRVVSGRVGPDGPFSPNIDFVLQYHDGQDFRDVPGTQVAGNEQIDWHARFEPVTATRVRLLVTKGLKDLARIWELELYHTTSPAK
jgi:hypothetical protein